MKVYIYIQFNNDTKHKQWHLFVCVASDSDNAHSTFSVVTHTLSGGERFACALLESVS
jgi:hypothetical protein